MYLQQRGSYWVVVDHGSNRVLDRRRSRIQAEQALRELERKRRRQHVRTQRKGKTK